MSSINGRTFLFNRYRKKKDRTNFSIVIQWQTTIGLNYGAFKLSGYFLMRTCDNFVLPYNLGRCRCVRQESPLLRIIEFSCHGHTYSLSFVFFFQSPPKSSQFSSRYTYPTWFNDFFRCPQGALPGCMLCRIIYILYPSIKHFLKGKKVWNTSKILSVGL